MKEALLTLLRDRTSTITRFRSASDKLAAILAAEVSKEITQTSAIEIHTPIAPATGVSVRDNVVLIPILRAGIALLQPFLMIFEDAKIGFLGIQRDEKTAQPSLYYQNLPSFNKEGAILLLDPMIATGGSAILAIDILLGQGVSISQIHLVGMIASTDGMKRVRERFPSLKYRIVAEDPTLNAQNFIVPGLGDFGDRYFGSKSLPTN